MFDSFVFCLLSYFYKIIYENWKKYTLWDETETEGGCDMQSFQTTQLAIPIGKRTNCLNLRTSWSSHTRTFTFLLKKMVKNNLTKIEFTNGDQRWIRDFHRKPDSPAMYQLPLPLPYSFPKILEIEINWNKNKSVHGPVLLALVCTSVKSPNADQTLLFLTYFWPMNHCWLTIHKFTFYFLRRLYHGKLASTLLYMIGRFVPEAKDSSNLS